jgi:hypothetical protein
MSQEKKAALVGPQKEPVRKAVLSFQFQPTTTSVSFVWLAGQSRDRGATRNRTDAG